MMLDRSEKQNKKPKNQQVAHTGEQDKDLVRPKIQEKN
jgi:hypothetical protein